MKNLFVVCACLVTLLSQPVACWAADPEVVVVQLTPLALGKMRVSVVRPGAKAETQEFSSNPEERAEGQQRLFQQFYQQGFTIQSTYSTISGTTTVVLVRGTKS
jgi:hypothetical protein